MGKISLFLSILKVETVIGIPNKEKKHDKNSRHGILILESNILIQLKRNIIQSRTGFLFMSEGNLARRRRVSFDESSG